MLIRGMPKNALSLSIPGGTRPEVSAGWGGGRVIVLVQDWCTTVHNLIVSLRIPSWKHDLGTSAGGGGLLFWGV